MKINKVVKMIATVYFAMYVVPPVIDGTVTIAKSTGKFINNKIKKSEVIKEIKKDFELRRQGIITVNYREIK